MRQIIIIKTPRGEAPKEIRQKWVGLMLPCIGKYPILTVQSVLTGESVDCNGDVYGVPQKESLKILAQKHPEAAAWWQSHGFPKPGYVFTFQNDEVMLFKYNPTGKSHDFWG